jgi:DNA-directed RNA polymerase
MTLLTQVQIEQQMREQGRDRILAMIQTAEEKGRAATAPYAQRVFRQYVLPLAAAIRADLTAERAGPYKAHAKLLMELEIDSVAFLTVRHVLNSCLASPQHHRQLGYSIGRTIHRELVLAQIKDELPDLYHTLARDFSRRMSQDERHRLTVFRMQAQKAGMEIGEWSIGSRDQVGLYMIHLLVEIGMIDLGPIMCDPHTHKREYRDVHLTDEALRILDEVRGYMAETLPSYGPCVEVPIPWTAMVGGGFHTPDMRRIHRTLVKTSATARPWVLKHSPPVFLSAVNALQGTAWRVNRGVLQVVQELASKGLYAGEVTAPTPPQKPERLPWMDSVEPGTMTPDQQAQLKTWKMAMVEWYEARKLHTGKYGRFYTATRQAVTFKDYPELYFVYFADSRGRLYPMTYGMSPQGSDLQKSLLEFARGMPLNTDSAISWFLIQGANKWGYDKATLEEREQWVRERLPQITNMAEDPVSNREWLQADKPLQFLAWLLEFRAWRQDPSGFLSRIPISMDGSCNGLQNFSAMLRDEVGGRATNLTDNDTMQDIYMEVARAAAARLPSVVTERTDLLDLWIKRGIERGLVKRAVMTTPYGVTYRSAVKYVVSDYLATGAAPEFPRKEWPRAAEIVMTAVWAAIGDVVVKAREAMDWLKKVGNQLADQAKTNPDPFLAWTTPSGFPASQAYFEMQVHRIRTLLHGAARIRVVSETDDTDIRRHSQSFAPNFVHSMDASHLHLVSARAVKEGIMDLAMIHDDYGTHAANAGRLYDIIREEFVLMYEQNDPIEDIARQAPTVPGKPEKGTLDLSEVLRSKFFFS